MIGKNRESLPTPNEGKKPGMTRRNFLLLGVVAAGAALLDLKTEAQTEQEPARPEIKKESPQRTAYDSRENYEKYAASFDQQFKNGNKPVGKKDLTDKEIRKMKETIDRAFENADKQREWLANIVYSPKYERRCIAEGLTPEQIKARRDIVLNNEPIMADSFHSLPSEDTGFYHEDTGECVVSLEKMSKTEPDPVVCHELTHAVTGMEKNMSDTAKRMYKEAFVLNPPKSLYDTIMGPPAKSHYATKSYLEEAHLEKPSELDARKTEFEYELEKLLKKPDVLSWKYGETFTEEHLNEALRLQKGGKLSQGSEDFLDHLKHEKIVEIMNTLA